MINRKIKPKIEDNIKVTLPIINSLSLDNSLKVYFVNKNTLPIVQLNLIIPSGSIYDKNKQGLSNLTSLLIDEGAGEMSGLEISEKLDTLGSILNINSNKEFTNLSLLMLKEHLAQSLDIFTKIILSPNFNKTDFNREKGRLKAQILQLNNDPAYQASAKINEIIYKKTPYCFPSNGISGSLEGISNSDVKDFHNKRYLPNGSYLIIVGDLEDNLFPKISTNYFSDWPSKQSNEKKQMDIYESDKQIFLINKPYAAQSEIRVGHFSKGRKSQDFYARTVLNSVIGGQFSSRINLNLREDKGFTYGAHSRYIYNQIGSTFLISTSVKTEDTSAAIKEILNELDRIKSTLTEKEVEFSKSYLIRSYPSLFETYSQIASNVSLLPIYDLKPEYFENYIDNIRKVKIEDVEKAANECIKIENLVIVVVGQSSILGSELNSLADKEAFLFSEDSKEI